MAQHGSDEWLAGAACHRSVEPVHADSTIRLSELAPKQKRELAGIVAAALATTAFAVVPALSPESLRQPLPSSALTLQFVPMPDAEPDTVTLAAVTVSYPAVRRSRTRPARAIASPLGSEPVPLVAAFPPVTMAPVATLGTITEPRESREGAGRAPEKRGGNAIARALLGTGRHKVRPFPVPGADDDD